MNIINVEDIFRIFNVRNRINKLNLYEIEWRWKGKKIEVPREDIEEFDFTGLNNLDFISVLAEYNEEIDKELDE